MFSQYIKYALSYHNHNYNKSFLHNKRRIGINEKKKPSTLQRTNQFNFFLFYVLSLICALYNGKAAVLCSICAYVTIYFFFLTFV